MRKEQRVMRLLTASIKLCSKADPRILLPSFGTVATVDNQRNMPNIQSRCLSASEPLDTAVEDILHNANLAIEASVTQPPTEEHQEMIARGSGLPKPLRDLYRSASNHSMAQSGFHRCANCQTFQQSHNVDRAALL